MKERYSIDIRQHQAAKERGHQFDNVFQKNLSTSGVRALQIHFIEAMMKGSEDQTQLDIAFMKGKDVIMRANVTMGASPFDLKLFAVAELKKRYAWSRVGKALQNADSFVIDGVTYNPRAFAKAPEYWSKRGGLDPRYAFSHSVACLWDCEDKVVKATKGMNAETNEFKAIVRKEMLPYHVAYLHWSFKVEASDGKGRSLDTTGMRRFLDVAASYQGGF